MKMLGKRKILQYGGADYGACRIILARDCGDSTSKPMTYLLLECSTNEGRAVFTVTQLMHKYVSVEITDLFEIREYQSLISVELSGNGVASLRDWSHVEL